MFRAQHVVAIQIKVMIMIVAVERVIYSGSSSITAENIYWYLHVSTKMADVKNVWLWLFSNSSKYDLHVVLLASFLKSYFVIFIFSWCLSYLRLCLAFAYILSFPSLVLNSWYTCCVALSLWLSLQFFFGFLRHCLTCHVQLTIGLYGLYTNWSSYAVIRVKGTVIAGS